MTQEIAPKGLLRRRGFVLCRAVLATILASVVIAVGGGDTSAKIGPWSDSRPGMGALGLSGVETTADGQTRMQSLSVAGVDTDQAAEISTDSSVELQTVEGFGAAMTHTSASLLRTMPDTDRIKLLEELFAPDGPVRLSLLRVPIGASDFVDREAFTFDDVPRGQTDWDIAHFTLAPDWEALIPTLQEVRKINPNVTLIASPWSPPAWLKTSGNLEGGRLLDEDRAYDSYARYLVRFLREYRDADLDIKFLTLQNEPQLRHPQGYPGTDMPGWQQAKLIERVVPALRAAGLSTKILGFDHNWELHPGDAATTPVGEDPDYEYAAALLRSSAAKWIDGIAFHCYYGNAGAQSWLLGQFPATKVWVTECSGSGSPDQAPATRYADTLAWQSTNLLIDSLRNRASGVLTFNLVLDENGGPHHGGCSTCTGVITLASNGTFTRNAEYFVLAHAARYLPAGSVQVQSTSNAPGLRNVSFQTPDGAVILLIWNSAPWNRTVRVQVDQRQLEVMLRGTSLNTVSVQPIP